MKNYYQEFKNLGLNDEQIEGLMVFVQGQVAETVYRRAVGAFSMEELKELEKKRTQIITDKRQINTDAGGDRGADKPRSYSNADGDKNSSRGANLFHSRGGRVGAGMEFVEKAYFEKTGQTMKELTDGILADYLERFLGMIKDLQSGMKKVAGASTDVLDELKMALMSKDAVRVKEVVGKVIK